MPSQDGRGGEAVHAAEKQQPTRERNEQAAQPTRSPMPTAQQQGARPSQTTGEARERENIGQAQNQPNERGGTVSARVDDQKRSELVDRLRRDREIEQARSNVSIRVNVGERLPDRVRPRPLPPEIVRTVPEYRGYEYKVIGDEIAIVEPRSREVVDVIPEGGYTGCAAEGGHGYERIRVALSSEQRDILKRAALRRGPGRTEPTVDRTCSDPSGVRRTFLTELMAVKVPFAQATDISARV